MSEDPMFGRPRLPGAHDEIRDQLVKTAIAPDLRDLMDDAGAASSAATAAEPLFDVILDFNTNFPSGPRLARDLFLATYVRGWEKPAERPAARFPASDLVRRMAIGDDALLIAEPQLAFEPEDRIDVDKSVCTEVFAFGRLARKTILSLASLRAATADAEPPHRLIHKIWRDHEITPMIYESVRTIKCDAARAAFGSAGRGIVWAVADTGVKGDHPHFRTHGTLDLPPGLQHRDFSGSTAAAADPVASALTDDAGHGTHVAGIIAGEAFVGAQASTRPGLAPVNGIEVTHEVRTDDDTEEDVDRDQQVVSGIAPLCKILSLRVLASGLAGNASNLMAAIGYIQQINGYGRDIKVHGLNLSLGYPFDAAWFAAGQSPLCAEVDRLVKCGVVVVVAAGNAGYGRVASFSGTAEPAALTCTIADPGNAELAITVGSTHRSEPHLFGVSYFSAKGPTADGRMKPDLVAPGERIVSCAIDAADADVAKYREDSGTSMAAPHVSAAIAAFLSVRGEYVGRPEAVKTLFIGSAMDLGRRPEFQGAGLLDLMKALQSV